MNKIRKFFDKNGKETEDPKDALKCHELEIDDAGMIVSDAWYFAEE